MLGGIHDLWNLDVGADKPREDTGAGGFVARPDRGSRGAAEHHVDSVRLPPRARHVNGRRAGVRIAVGVVQDERLALAVGALGRNGQAAA